ncbi:LysR family transcriptional regulator [Aurantimonas sp. VKM B-3413]|uniref:LysR family transcriptional regulator n=1 Tax=Aurantimonas sp. VKM B-3413 TaxID=2779401 RepID=UPI001E570EC4|nr:LysR family transcriptional regulator [Aurantimonas sp. VKM B-3413]MCB8839509.1 LysR family transcriptional regulator [Aurantimonas sp. VKM B-3413]
MDRLASMAVFVKVAEAGSFSAAAKALDLSQQMVGKHVAALEARLSARLIARTTRRQSLTELGRAYYHQCRIVLAEAEAADALAEEIAAAPRGRLRVNAPVTFGSESLTPLVVHYMERYPQVEVDLVLGDRKVDLIEEGFEAVIRIGALADSSLIARPLAPYRLVVVAAPSYLARRGEPEHPRDLAGHECIVFIGSSETRSHVWVFTKGGESEEVRVNGRLRTNDARAIVAAVLAGSGIAMGAESLLGPLIVDGRLNRLLPEWEGPSWEMHVLTAPDRRPTAKLKAFVDMVAAEFPRRR